MEDLGFKCGLEIHQRLDTKKLFCSCYFDANKQQAATSEEKETKTRRRLRAVVGEMGLTDQAALFEAQRKREFLYFAPSSSSCLVELDEEPPHKLNREALEIALQISLMLHATPVNEIIFMRKTVIDGSSPSGFQRTALVALNGQLQTSRGIIGIPTICLEEDSAGIVEKRPENEDAVSYRLDRLGIPLIEIATDASIKNGEHAKEVAERMGSLLRSTGKVQRGIGSIRQDLNVSISEGARVEIKGAQELAMIPKLIDGETERQKKLVELKKTLSEKDFRVPPFSSSDVTSIFSNNPSCFVSRLVAKGSKAIAMKIPSISGMLKIELMPNHRLGTELSDYAKASSGVSGIIHSDEDMAKYGISEGEKNEVAKTLFCSEDDAWVMIVAEESKATSALQAIHRRASLLSSAIPEETRRAVGEKSVFMRPLPGGARMYPETDVLPVSISETEIKKLSENLPASTEERLAKYLSLGLNKQIAEKMLKSPDFNLFEELVSETKADASVIAITLLETIVSLRREGAEIPNISKKDFNDLFRLYASNYLTKAAIQEALKLKCANPEKPIGGLIDANNLKRFSEDELLNVIAILSSTLSKREQFFAEIMKRYKLRVDVKQLQGMLEKKD